MSDLGGFLVVRLRKSLKGNRSYIYEPGSAATFIPSPEFNRSDADVGLCFFSVNGKLFTEPVDDPLFSAHQPYSLPSVGRVESVATNQVLDVVENKTYYTSDNLANVIGCTHQHQICNPNIPPHIGCTPLAGRHEVKKSVKGLSINFLQAATAALLLSTVQAVGLFSPWRPSDLVAQQEVEAGGYFSLPLPNNQWTIEFQAWHSTWMALMQGALVDRAIGPTKPDDRQWIIPPNDTAEYQLCHAQKIRTSGDYANISAFGLIITLVLGGVIIALNLGLGTIISWIQQRRGVIDQRLLEWKYDEDLQLQRVAYEKSGIGTWEGISNLVPTTVHGEKLRPLADSTVQPARPDLPRRPPQSTGSSSLHHPSLVPEDRNPTRLQQNASSTSSLSSQATMVPDAIDRGASTAHVLSINFPSPTLADVFSAEPFRSHTLERVLQHTQVHPSHPQTHMPRPTRRSLESHRSAPAEP